MAFTLPENYRLTKARAKSFSYIGKEILDMISDETRNEDGYFFVPRQGQTRGGFFLVRATITEGWHAIAVNIPTQGRTPTWEEMDYVRRIFFTEDSVSFSFYPGKNTYIVKNWIHIWQPQDESISQKFLPPIFQPYFIFRRASMWTRLWRAIRNNLKKDFQTIKKPVPPSTEQDGL